MHRVLNRFVTSHEQYLSMSIIKSMAVSRGWAPRMGGPHNLHPSRRYATAFGATPYPRPSPSSTRLSPLYVATPTTTSSMPDSELSPSQGYEHGPLANPPVVLYNTMSRSKETVSPRAFRDKSLSMYVCGVTVYDLSHIGHARVYVTFDVLRRVLQRAGYDVTYVRNYTDIDDKIIARAKEVGEEPLELSARYIEEFRADMARLYCQSPTHEPQATQYVTQMITTIERILAQGHGYVTPDTVYFDVPSLPGYGALSGRKMEDNLAGASQRVDAAENNAKRHPADFALWKSAKPGEPTWESPWGPGRPGWHVECSAMIEALLGDTVDIHGGGMDLTFPHHENELAQTRGTREPSPALTGTAPHDPDCPCCTQKSEGRDFVRYWVHNGFVNVDAEKMSKSVGNFFTIRDVLDAYHPLTLRWFLLSSQYRTPVNYTQSALEEAGCRVYYVWSTLQLLHEALAAGNPDETSSALAEAREAVDDTLQGMEVGGNGPLLEVVDEGTSCGTALVAGVVAALRNDLNTPEVLSLLSAPLKAINDLCSTKQGKKHPGRLQTLAGLQAALDVVLGDCLGLPTDEVETTLAEMKTLCLTRSGLSNEEMDGYIAKRAEARKAKDFATSDAVRDELDAKGIVLMDKAGGGTEWQPKAVADGC